VVAQEHDRDVDGVADPAVEPEQRLVARHRVDPSTGSACVAKRELARRQTAMSATDVLRCCGRRLSPTASGTRSRR
jgi:hypothetical protein